MARTISTIKSSLGNYYIGLPTVQSAYGLTSDDVDLGFDALFSVATNESKIFYAIAFCINAFEQMFDLFKTEIEKEIAANYIANKAWWHAAAMAFQKGYALVMNETTFIYSYASIDTTAQIIKRAAIRENIAQNTGVCKVQLYVATEANGVIAALTQADAELFEAYANQIKPAGVLIDVITGAGDVLVFGITIDYNPLILSSSGLLISDGVTYPVNAAIATFIDTLNDNDFGGKLNLTKLIDAVQAAYGVVDVEITAFSINGAEKQTWGTFQSTNGWFTLESIQATYQPHIL
jgi:hypothetical protein